MKPPSSDAESLRIAITAPVRTSNSFFVAADELGDFERGQQTIGQAVRRRRLDCQLERVPNPSARSS